MVDIIAALKSPEECDTVAQRADGQGKHDMAVAARRKGLELRVKAHGVLTEVESECLQAVYAYETTLAAKNGRRTPASRTWMMIQTHGIIGAVERAVDRPKETAGYRALHAMGLSEYAFEAVILRHPEHFSAKAIARSRERLAAQSG